jgi:ketosteroid isomerase-like protein
VSENPPEPVVRDLLQAWDDADFDRAAGLIADDFTATAHTDGSVITKQRYLDSHRVLHGALPDLTHHVVSASTLGPDRVRVVAYVTATNDRPIAAPDLGIDLPNPTGRVFRTTPHTDVFVVRDGRVASYTSEQPPGSGLRGLLQMIMAAQADERGSDE